MYVELRKIVQMNWFAGQKLRHRCREQTYGHQGGKTAVGWVWWCAELGDWDWHVYSDVYKIDDWLKKKKKEKIIYKDVSKKGRSETFSWNIKKVGIVEIVKIKLN